MMKDTKKSIMSMIAIAVMIAIVVIIPVREISAEGCCFNPDTGKCLPNAEESSCTSPGEFYASPSCSESKCEMGCCMLGSDTRYITPRECEILSQNFGLEYSWDNGVDQAGCDELAEIQVKGACLYGEYKPFDCIYSTLGDCASSNFNPGAFCTNPELNTTCNHTADKMCYGEDVYGKDSCGNPDGVAADCDYENGTICTANTSRNAYCRDLSCKDINGKTRKNGEAWCYYDLTGEYDTMAQVLATELSNSPIGSRFYSKYCLNGEIVTEPCADYRMEWCESGKCEINKGTECLAANVIDESTGKAVVDEGACDEKYCFMWHPHDCVGNGTKQYCGSQRDSYQSDPDFGSSADEITTDALKALGLEACVPIMAPGFDFWQSSGGGSVCSSSDYAAKLEFEWSGYDHGYFRGWTGSHAWWGGENSNWHFIPGDDENYGTSVLADAIGIGYKSEPPYATWETHSYASGGYDVDEALDEADKYSRGGLAANTRVINQLGQRCRHTSDCDGKADWMREDGAAAKLTGAAIENAESNNASITGDAITGSAVAAGVTTETMPVSGGWGSPVFTFTFACTPYEASSGDDKCSACGRGGYACSEYRCLSLGTGCKYSEPGGADKGYCVASSDRSPPSISLKSMEPSSPLRPYTPVTITIKTNEASRCKFNINNAGLRLDSMNFSFGSGYDFEHTITLTIPGQTRGIMNRSMYPLLTNDGNYTIYVRCQDAAENGQTMDPFRINFEVMQYPDTDTPKLSNFTPASGSAIRFNTTEKRITFQMNEPAECKWSFQDESFTIMENYLSCDIDIKSDPLEKYGCYGMLTNITLNLSESTKFYIKCKDQAWLENDSVIINDVEYHRNEHTSADDYEYILKASEELEIIELSPNGNVERPASNTSVEMVTVTSGGVYSGRSTCFWRRGNESNLSGVGFTRFSSTGISNIHKQLLNALPTGENYIEAKCNDSAGNEARKTVMFNLAIDSQSPIITRIFERANLMNIKTNEEALCYISFNKSLGCSFNILNATLMSGVEKDHSSAWVDDAFYFIKCRDYRGNEDVGCGKIIKTY